MVSGEENAENLKTFVRELVVDEDALQIVIGCLEVAHAKRSSLKSLFKRLESYLQHRGMKRFHFIKGSNMEELQLISLNLLAVTISLS